MLLNMNLVRFMAMDGHCKRQQPELAYPARMDMSIYTSESMECNIAIDLLFEVS